LKGLSCSQALINNFQQRQLISNLVNPVSKNYPDKIRFLAVIPAYNEEKSLRSVVEGALARICDVLVINDGSTDSTSEVIKRLGVPYIDQKHMGKGAALRAGFDYAVKKRYDWIITMDGDGQHDPGEIPVFIEAIRKNGTDLVVGSRMNDTREMPFVRKATNRLMSSLISSLAGCRIPDTQCGFRAIRCSVFKKVALKTSHFDTETELLIKAVRAEFKVSSVLISTIYNGSKSSVNKITDTARFVRLLWMINVNG